MIPEAFDQPPIEGSLLIASPSLQDGVFDRSIIFLYQHSLESGAHGYILNRPTGEKVGEILCSAEFQALRDLPIYYGGPVDSDKLSFCSFHSHIDGALDSQISISSEEACQLLDNDKVIVRAYIGSSVWTAGQLENELEQTSWYIAPTIPDLLTMPQDATLWSNTLQALSPFHHLISLTPENPFLN